MTELYPGFCKYLIRVAFTPVMGGILSLVGTDTEIGFWLLAIAVIIFTTIYWQKFHTHNFKNVFTRVSLLIFSNVLVVSSVGLTLNRSGNFYSSWSDLFGINEDLKKIAVAPENLALITQNDLKSAKRTPAGSLIFKEVITGETSNVSGRVYVVLSPKVVSQLESSSNFTIGNNYQVTELFPGYPGVPETWIGSLKGLDAIEKMEMENKIPPTIAIIPSINVVPGLDTECLNIPGAADVESWLTTDMKFFAQKFIGIDDRKWSTFGYSTGGWCAAELGIRHQNQFNLAVSLAGYFSPSFSAGINKRERNVLSKEYDLISKLNEGPNSLKMLAIYSSHNDFETKSLMKFKSQIGNLLSLKLVEIPEGGHNIKIWKPYVYTGFEWINSSGPDLGNPTLGN